MYGTVKKIVADKGFGFIVSPGQPDTFFHVNDLSDDLAFDETLQERRVRFDVTEGTKGPRATIVSAAD